MASARIVISLLVLCAIWCAHDAVNCTETGAGRFAEPADDTCKNYTRCIYVKQTNSYITFNTVCPSVSVFNPKTSKCTSTTEYVCNNEMAVKAKAKPKVCTYEGFIADPEHTNCSTYIQCVNIAGALTQWRRSCPKNTYFNPMTTLCETNFNCENAKFRCSSPGRITDMSDPTCRKYYKCVLLNNGKFAQYDFSCPYDWMFDPRSSLCTMDYVCR